jgi:hypothetical protein
MNSSKTNKISLHTKHVTLISGHIGYRSFAILCQEGDICGYKAH